jgi:hypothetical protein
MDWWGWAYLTIGALFLAVELPAAFLGPSGSTLSEHVWSWFHVRDARPTALTWVLRAVLLAFTAWLTIHLSLGVWPS